MRFDHNFTRNYDAIARISTTSHIMEFSQNAKLDFQEIYSNKKNVGPKKTETTAK